MSGVSPSRKVRQQARSSCHNYAPAFSGLLMIPVEQADQYSVSGSTVTGVPSVLPRGLCQACVEVGNERNAQVIAEAMVNNYI